ncbi:D-alanyl-lipoteichoic acid biosynthesis protein DltD [Peptostreptococcaceae bacterium OttesenSCG-928-C18]|nr:D-alanyl-lipoteichoic acid biosynthesis protein DltD [Peptostreptococcaceae bacterium OttesenSCG-928-C18]
MNKINKSKIGSFIISFFLVITILLIYTNYLKNYIKENYNSDIYTTFDEPIRNKGTALLNNSLDKKDLLIMGSSELSSTVEQNIVNLFPNNEIDKVAAITGSAHVQSLLNAIKLGSLEVDKDNNVVIIISLQWFLGEEINYEGFNANFSKLQYYKLMENKNLSDDLKNRIADRVNKLTLNTSENFDINIHSRLYDRPILSKLMFPFDKFNKSFLEIKDYYNSAKLTKERNGAFRKPKIDLDWTKLNNRAEEQGSASVSNNDMMVDNYYYEEYLIPILDDVKDSNTNAELLTSNEFADFEILLDLCKELNIKPYFVFTSTNGYYYDYTGLSKEKRHEFYDKVEDLATKRNFDYLDLRDYEYEKYFYKDVMHLGWKGWLYISENIIEHFK